MARRRLTLDDARNMAFEELDAAAFGLIAQYEAPDGETEAELSDRLNRTFDELPDIYAWLLHLESFFDYWAEFWMKQEGQKGEQYKEMRVKRDTMKRAASAAKMRYEATSRRLTKIQGAESDARMPRGR